MAAPKLGYTLSCEEFPGSRLVELARQAEEAGADFLGISDHFHPWVGKQGNSPLVWAVLGGVAQTTERIEVMTGVTCPTIRVHPAIVAQAAATTAEMFGGRFILGVGAGEQLNEHVVGRGWPANDVRLEMLEEAIGVLRKLWEGERTTIRGKHFTVEQARIYTLPEEPPPIYVAAGGDIATKLAGRVGDGLVGLVPDESVIGTFEEAGGAGKPKVGQVHVCVAPDEDQARATAVEWWPNAAVPGDLSWELAEPPLFEALAEEVSEDDVAESVICGPDAGPILEEVRAFADAGYTHVYLHQVGPDQDALLDLMREELLPELRD